MTPEATLILEGYERDITGPLTGVGTKTILRHVCADLRPVVDDVTRCRLSDLLHDRRAMHEPNIAVALANLRRIVEESSAP